LVTKAVRLSSTDGPSESKEKVAVPEVTGGAANRLREDKILSICISIKLGSPESGNKIASSDGVSGCGIPGQDGGSHEDKKLGLRDRVHASVGVAVMAASSWLGAAAEAQEESKRKVQRKEHSWKLSAVSEVLPGKIGTKLTARIEGDTFVCRSSDVPSSKSH